MWGKISERMRERRLQGLEVPTFIVGIGMGMVTGAILGLLVHSSGLGGVLPPAPEDQQSRGLIASVFGSMVGVALGSYAVSFAVGVPLVLVGSLWRSSLLRQREDRQPDPRGENPAR